MRLLSKQGGLVTSAQGVKVWTEPLNPVEIEDILVVPGGCGAKRLFYLDREAQSLFKKAAENSDYCLSIGEGIGLLVQTGVLYHRIVADTPLDEDWKRMFHAGVERVPDVRWVADGKFYSCSSALKSVDMILDVISDCLDVEDARSIADKLEFVWDTSENGVVR